jgi:hypothetical protein
LFSRPPSRAIGEMADQKGILGLVTAKLSAARFGLLEMVESIFEISVKIIRHFVQVLSEHLIANVISSEGLGDLIKILTRAVEISIFEAAALRRGR